MLNYKFSTIAFVFFIGMLFLVPTVQAQPLENTIRVGIWSNQRNILVSADVGYKIVNDDNNKTLGTFPANEKAAIAYSDGAFTLNGKKIDAVKLKIQKAKNDEEYSIEVNNKKYRGDISIHITNGNAGMTVINTLPVEKYLYGIIAKEISPNWPLEAVKAQAVAARTYALYNKNKHQNDGYDVCATTDCQVYGGRESEVPRGIKAVDTTADQVIVYQGKLIPAYFHSSSGGYTENSETVWGTYLPYLRGVVDYDQDSPQYKWEKQVTPNELEEALSRAGYSIGTIKAIGISPLTAQPVSTVDRGISGRVKIIRFIGSNGSIQLTGEKLRKILSLKSSLFDIRIMLPVQKSIEFEISDGIGNYGSKKVEINLPPRSEKGYFTDKEDIHRISGRANEIIIISGYGWGHGIGLSQWGAKAMAEKGPQEDPTYFKEILKHYYQGVEVKKLPKGV